MTLHQVHMRWYHEHMSAMYMWVGACLYIPSASAGDSQLMVALALARPLVGDGIPRSRRCSKRF